VLIELVQHLSGKLRVAPAGWPKPWRCSGRSPAAGACRNDDGRHFTQGRAARPRHEAAADVKSPSTLNILVVEDNPDLAANIVDYLEERGHTVDAAADGVTGLRLASGGDFDVIVLDLMLPRMDGLTLCRRLRSEAVRPTPVLILTARGTLDDKVAGFDCGADDYVVKPFELRELELRLQALARRARSGGGLQKLTVGGLGATAAASNCRRSRCASWSC
jgi:CheY-like chemotaxis protein